MSDLAKIDTLHANFPDGFAVPPLLLAFADWVNTNPDAYLGFAEFQSDRFDDWWIENGADLHPYFAFFLQDGCGGNVGFWLYELLETVDPPIVWLGSEGEMLFVADNLEEFLFKLATGTTGVGELDSRDDDAREAVTTKFLAWLTPRTASERVRPRRPHPDFAEWMAAFQQRECDLIAADPTLLELAERLRRFVPPNAEPWQSAHFQVVIVGENFVMSASAPDQPPLTRDELAAIRQLLTAARRRRAVRMPDRGLWYSARLQVGAAGAARLKCEFLGRPKIDGQQPVFPVADYLQDLREFPRSAHWMPDWLKELVRP